MRTDSSPPDRSGPALLHVVLRTTPSENRKNRPEWYSKARCIASVFDAVTRAREAGIRVRVVAAVDVSSGLQMPAAAARLVEHADEIWVVRGGTAAKSWRPVVRAVRSHLRPADDDLVYFVEDDHLHDLDALTLLVDGTSEYRLLYALASEHGIIEHGVDGWARVPGGTSTFAVTGRAFREDARRHLWMSCGGGAWDELSWRALGSHASPPGLGYVVEPFRMSAKWSRPWGLRPIRHAVFRALSLALSRGRSRSIALRTPIQATHCETSMVAGDTDWAARAASLHAPTTGDGVAGGVGRLVRGTRRDEIALASALGYPTA